MGSTGFFVKGYDALLRYLLSFEGMEAERFHVEAAAYVKTQILMRTTTGVDADGQTFTPYSRQWKWVRQKKGLPVSKVDLFFSGHMLAALTWKANKERAILFFRPSSDLNNKSNPEKAYYNQEGRTPRRFFAMSDKDINQLARLYWNILKEKLK